MLRIYIVLLCALLMSPGVRAACILASGQPTTLNISSQLITISADAPIDTSTPVAQYDSNVYGGTLKYDHCVTGDEYGKRVLNLSGQDTTTQIYQTNVPGLGIKLLASNGVAFGSFPQTAYVKFPPGSVEGSFYYNAGFYYRIQFFKTGNLKLSNPAGDTIIPPGIIAYHYVQSDSPASYALNLNVGDIKIISTPSCTADSAKTVDFNTVTPTLLSAGVTRDLSFSIICKSDYGAYTAKASIIAATPSSDGSYIRVQDAAGNYNKLGIRITDGSSQVMKVNGSTNEEKSSTSNGPAEFAWKATLIAGNTATPAGGTFTAKAEIVFDIQ